MLEFFFFLADFEVVFVEVEFCEAVVFEFLLLFLLCEYLKFLCKCWSKRGLNFWFIFDLFFVLLVIFSFLFFLRYFILFWFIDFFECLFVFIDSWLFVFVIENIEFGIFGFFESSCRFMIFCVEKFNWGSSRFKVFFVNLVDFIFKGFVFFFKKKSDNENNRIRILLLYKFRIKFDG